MMNKSERYGPSGEPSSIPATGDGGGEYVNPTVIGKDLSRMMKRYDAADGNVKKQTRIGNKIVEFKKQQQSSSYCTN